MKLGGGFETGKASMMTIISNTLKIWCKFWEYAGLNSLGYYLDLLAFSDIVILHIILYNSLDS